jgi:hypothetical protein
MKPIKVDTIRNRPVPICASCKQIRTTARNGNNSKPIYFRISPLSLRIRSARCILAPRWSPFIERFTSHRVLVMVLPGMRSTCKSRPPTTFLKRGLIRGPTL